MLCRFVRKGPVSLQVLYPVEGVYREYEEIDLADIETLRNMSQQEREERARAGNRR